MERQELILIRKMNKNFIIEVPLKKSVSPPKIAQRLEKQKALVGDKAPTLEDIESKLEKASQ